MAMLNALDLGSETPEQAAKQTLEHIIQPSYLQERLEKLYSKAHSSECRALIGTHVQRFLNAVGAEVPLPFGDLQLTDECDEKKYIDFDNLPDGMHLGHIQNKTYTSDNPDDYIDDPANLKLLYGILTHNDPQSTIRLIQVLYEPGHVFVIHVDGKESSEETYEVIRDFCSNLDYVHLIPHPHRVRVNWGGFSMVNATLQILQYALGVNDYEDREALDFHKFVHMASSTYPLASNTEIRRRIALYPLDANLMHVIMKPSRPHPSNWHYFVECDDAVHRIYRLHPLSTEHGGVELHTSSQWFVLSREFSEYLAKAEEGSFVERFLKYAEHVVVADETFFGTVIRHTSFCKKHHNWNFLHLQFDRWENELNTTYRDPRKCIMPSPDHCGRSPTTMTMDYLAVLELSGDLFARKFDDSVDSDIKTVLDQKRAKEEERLNSGLDTKEEEKDLFAGHGVLLVAKETITNDTVPLCLGIGSTANKVKLVPCFYEWILPTLAPGWQTGAVILEETMPHNRWNFGPCSSDGTLERLENGEMNMTPGEYSPNGPRCMLTQVDGLRAGRCLDGDVEQIQPGGQTHVFPCVKRWNQFVSIGNGDPAPRNSIHTTVPRHIVRRIRDSGRPQESYLCLGVLGRGDADEEQWAEDAKQSHDADTGGEEKTKKSDEEGGIAPLSKWQDEQLVMTKCTNKDAVIEWLFVPFIVEDEAEQDEQDGDSASDKDEL